jgi:D-tagatose-1,6-bisphosphate aldolase subunit GatZ/KbaZ
MISPLKKILESHKSGQPAGIYSVCSANRYALEAALLQAKDDNSLVLIESTSNQVDQFGGYTGMTPAQFVAYVKNIARKMEFPFESVVLGGDHLGPNVWQHEKAASAMEKARQLIRAYVSAGFCKIHLDTSMRCADDPGDPHDPPAPEIIAGRASELCEVAEKTYYANTAHPYPPLYVFGTEVPIPGGAREEINELKPCDAEDTVLTIELTRQAFLKRGLDAAWERVIAVVVQPGVEFADATVIDYDRIKASQLSALIEKYGNLVYEAHSTDYQTKEALREMVEDHFAILKVGPRLTFAFREAVFALAEMEKEWLAVKRKTTPSRIKEAIEEVMKKKPEHWQKHYKGNEAELFFARQYSYSDRIRYYWPNREISRALDTLIHNLSENPLPLNLLSQYLPLQHQAVREGEIPNTPVALIHHKIMEVTAVYSEATRLKTFDAVAANWELNKDD